ncbi:hypothetical protein GCM10007973_12810 [Polymorphobacter multimanifer]|nr:hypothetical protein [Polymorphobacter multimanifer]GGI77381.1 hypothetical protein GCM10007973_12810 [Polymorphobacter multimanifer]
MGKNASEPTQADLAAKAAATKQAAEPAPRPEPEPTANKGMINTDRPDMAPSGALDAEGHRPVLERSRKAR